MSKVKKDFLFELGTEELPPKALKKLSQLLLDNVTNKLKESKINFSQTKWFASPRRISFIIKNLAPTQDKILLKKQGPLVNIAYKDGKPTKVGLGFAKSCNVTLDKLDIIDTPKGNKLFYKINKKGNDTIKLLPDIITKSIKKLPIPKMMRWGDSSVEFVRPVHWVLALYDKDIVDMEILGHKADNITYGHRFHHPEAITIDNINDYSNLLANAMVIVDWNKRKQKIIEQTNNIARKNNYQVILDEYLVEEVCAIVEYPNAILCTFNKIFLRIPHEVLISSMNEHQKCFALLDKNGLLVQYFITISNIQSKKSELIANGNQKVMNSRLSDAAFFYDTDLKSSLNSLLLSLKNVTFQNKLGNMYQKSQRIANTSQNLAKLTNNADTKQSYRAGLLAKADLISNMVFEFPKLQGIIGKYYAKANGESEIIADAIEQQYWPKYSGDELPKNNISACVALAEKLDTLVGIFSLGQKPTGNKDPFAIRRSAIGILRILRDTNIDISLETSIDICISSYKKINNLEFKTDVKTEIVIFCIDRLKNLYKYEGFTIKSFEAINNTNYDSIKDFEARLKAVNKFNKLDKSQNLIAAHKRVSNILSINTKEKIGSYNIKLSQFHSNEYELALAYTIKELTPTLEKYINNREYNYALELLNSLDTKINDFFENVMIMDKDIKIRNNRVALLANLNKIFTYVADISKL